MTEQVPILSGEFGQLYYCDCMDPVFGLPSLEDNSIDLIFSDIKWGQEYDGQDPHGINQQNKHTERVNYDDTFDPEFYKKFHAECMRVAKAVVFCVGRINKYWWIRNIDPLPLGELSLIYANGQGSSKIAKHAGKMEYLAWSNTDYFVKRKFFRDFLITYIHNGLLRDNYEQEPNRIKKFLKKHQVKPLFPVDFDSLFQYVHPSPKDFETWNRLIMELKPKSICDPMSGTCPIGEIGEFNQIEWLGHEINQAFINDGLHRVNLGVERRDFLKKKQKQVKLPWQKNQA